MPYFVYILYSEKFDSYYVGYSENPELRLATKHNKGYVKSTKKYMPYAILKTKLFATELEAIQEERRIKNKKSKKYIIQLISGNW